LALAGLGLGLWSFDLIPRFPPPSPPLERSRETSREAQRSKIIRKESARPPSHLPPGAQTATRRPDSQSATEYRDQGARDFENGKFAEAIVAFSEAIDLDRTDHRVFNDRGNAYLELGHFDAALQDYDQAIHLNAAEWESHYNRGIALFNLKRYDQAVEAFTEAIRLNPGYSKAYEHRARAHEQVGHSAQAASDRATAAELDSGSGPPPPD
jgi:tetratricopeptide (TPR) repeat protein